MPEYDNTNRGSLFENDKGDNPNRPDYKGTLNVDGKEYWLSMWDKISKNGKAYYSLSIQEKTDRPTGKESPAWRDAGAKFKKNDVTEAKDLDEMTNQELLDSIPF